MKLTLLLLLAGLCALPAFAKPADLLPVGSLPPDITARDADGNVHHVRSLVGKKRVVLLMGTNKAYLAAAQHSVTQFAERDIITLTAAGRTRAFYLIGKDGLVKMARYTPPPNAELFATIDAMPMRRAEMRGRK